MLKWLSLTCSVDIVKNNCNRTKNEIQLTKIQNAKTETVTVVNY